MIIRIFTTFFLLCIPVAVQGGNIYKHIDESGVLIFTDVPDDSSAEVFASDRKVATKPAHKKSYDKIIDSKANKYSVDPSLIKAVIKVESGFNERAVSRKGAKGLMQLMPATAREMGVFNLFNPEDNIEAGTRYLRYLLEKFDGDLKLALAAYNAGPTSVKKHGTVPPIKETKRYLKKVFRYYGKDTHNAPASNTIYKIELKDGTTIFTDSRFYGKAE
jgi:soluble lytic murein transglycosylase-like protein